MGSGTVRHDPKACLALECAHGIAASPVSGPMTKVSSLRVSREMGSRIEFKQIGVARQRASDRRPRWP